MTRIAFIAGIVALALCAPAYAGDKAKELPDASSCKAISVARDNIDPSKWRIPVTLRGSGLSLQSFEACNKGADSHVVKTWDTRVGVQIVLETDGKSGVVRLPPDMLSGVASQVVCAVVDGEMTATLYEYSWADGLPERIALQKQPLIRPDVHVKRCIEGAPREIKDQLNKKPVDTHEPVNPRRERKA